MKPEHTLSDLVNRAYGLTPAEIDLMWQTAPPRMPVPLPATVTNLLTYDGVFVAGDVADTNALLQHVEAAGKV